MTDLQMLIMEAIDQCGGWANFDQINDHVSKLFDNLKRRDGTPYTSECRRAVQASLSNNPTARPFFKKETRKGVQVFGLAKRSVEFLHEYRKSKAAGGDITMTEADDSKQQQHANDNGKEDDDHTNNDNDSVHDDNEEQQAEDEDEGEDFKEESTKEEKERSERHMYGNRVKRAQKLAQAGKRQLREVSTSASATGATAANNNNSHNSDSQRARKRRKN